MTLDDETAFFRSAPQLLPFRFAGRLSDVSREGLGQWAGHGADDLLASGLAGDIFHEGVPITPEERDILAAGLRWNNMFEEDEDEKSDLTWLERHPSVTPDEVEASVARWRFEPAGPAGEAVEEAAVTTLRQLGGAGALLTAWRVNREGQRARAYCIVCAAGSSPARLWVRVHFVMRSARHRQAPTAHRNRPRSRGRRARCGRLPPPAGASGGAHLGGRDPGTRQYPGAIRGCTGR